MSLVIALAGNPNAGKSTLFNGLTGIHQHIGNWPGKTIERKEGVLYLPDQPVIIVDLPGTYSLTAFSTEELITRNFILEEQPNVVIAAVDAANLERNLYLVVQLLEMGVPLILALNMCDVAEKRGLRIDTARLEQLLGGIPVIRVVGSQGAGLDTLAQTIRQALPTAPNFQAKFGARLEYEISILQSLIEQETSLCRYPTRWLAIKLLEGDVDLAAKATPALLSAAESAIRRIQRLTGEAPDILIADSRYAWIEAWVKEVVTRPQKSEITVSDRLDRILAHPLWGLPIFLLLMWLVFQFTANVSAPYVDWIDSVMSGAITHRMLVVVDHLGLENRWPGSLLIDGVVTGVGSVLTFIPVLACLYFAIAVLEDSGYMARAALVMDRFMRLFGLHGKSVLPLIVGFGCTVPAIYATRTLENETDRKITAFLTTFMSCGARLPVYVLFGATFFGAMSGNFIFAMYLTGIGVAILTSLMMTRLVFPNKMTLPLVIELPPYRMPGLKNIWLEVRLRTTAFIYNAGTVILATAIVIWVLLAVPGQPGQGHFGDVEPDKSLFSNISRAMAPLLAPAGFGDWRASGALITGFAAKEAVIATLNQVYTGTTTPGVEIPSWREDAKTTARSFGDATILTGQEILNILPHTLNLLPGVDIGEVDLLGQETAVEDSTTLNPALKRGFTPLTALAFNIFILLYAPCTATIGAMRHEFGTRWMLLQATYTIGVAWLAAVLVYQVGGRL